MSDWKQSAAELAEAFSNTDATPGGGSAAGVAGAIGCALARMAAGISAQSTSKKMDGARRAALVLALADFKDEQAEFQRLTEADAEVFDAFMAVYALPKHDAGRPKKLRDALVRAGEVPLETAGKAAEVLEKLEAVKTRTVGTVTSDIHCAIHLVRAAGLCALENVEINAASLQDAAAARRLRDAAARVKKDLG